MRKLLNLYGKTAIFIAILAVPLLVVPDIGSAQKEAQQNTNLSTYSTSQPANPLKVQSPARHGSGDRAGA